MILAAIRHILHGDVYLSAEMTAHVLAAPPGSIGAVINPLRNACPTVSWRSSS